MVLVKMSMDNEGTDRKKSMYSQPHVPLFMISISSAGKRPQIFPASGSVLGRVRFYGKR